MKTKVDYIQIKPIKKLKGYFVQYVGEEYCILSKGLVLYRSDLNFDTIQKIVSLPIKGLFKILSRFILTQRLLRLFIYNVIHRDGDEYYIHYRNEHIILNIKTKAFKKVGGFKRACRVMRGGVSRGGDGHLYFGEYIPNSERKEIYIYKLENGSTQVNVVYTLPEKSIRHVHGIYFDSYEKAMWVCCGDIKNECRVFKTTDGFKTIEMVGMGDETWRTVSFLFDETYVYFAMDAEFQQNYVYRIHRETGRREAVTSIDGPCFFSEVLGSYKLFQVTAEGCPSQTRYSAKLYACSDSQSELVLEVPKDRWHSVYFMYGIIHFSLRDSCDRPLYLNFIGLTDVLPMPYEVSLS